MTKNQPKRKSKITPGSRKAAKTTVKQGNRTILALGIVLVLAVIGIIIGVNLTSQPAQVQSDLNAFPSEIDVKQAYELYQDGVFLLDVRTQGEWDEIHVPNATLIPLDQLESRLSELSKDRDIVVMCRSGNRSQQGRDILLNAGFMNVTSMDGGIVDWKAAGYPTTP